MWIQLLTALIAFFFTKKKTGSTTKAAIAAGLVGVGTNWVVENTQFGQDHLASINSSINNWFSPEGGSSAISEQDKVSVTAPDGTITQYVPPGPGITSSVADVLKSWGPMGTAGVVGTTALATDSTLKKWLPIVGVGAVLVLLIK